MKPISSPLRAVIGLAAVAVMLDVAAVRLALAGAAGGGLSGSVWLDAALAHLLVVAAVAAGAVRVIDRFPYAPGVQLTVVALAFGGPLGAACGLLAGLVAAALEAAPNRLGLAGGGIGGARPRVAVERAPGVVLADESLCDVFRFGELAQRRNAVALIGANYNPGFARALRMALTDEHNAIRVQAGMVVQQLEDRYERRAAEMVAQTDGELEAHGFGASDTHLRLALFYDEYAFSGVLDDSRMLAIQARALRAYRQHLVAHPHDTDAIAAVGRLLIRAGQHAVVADWLSEHVADGRGTTAALMWLAEALYRSRRYAELNRLLTAHGAALASHIARESSLQESLTLWREHPEALDPDTVQAPADWPGGSVDR